MDFRDSQSLRGEDVATAVAVEEVVENRLSDSRSRLEPYKLIIDNARDALLTDFGKETLRDRYLLPGESYQDLFVRVASAYSDDAVHAQRIYDYISKLWFMPATPVLSNGGTGRGLPISLHSTLVRCLQA